MYLWRHGHISGLQSESALDTDQSVSSVETRKKALCDNFAFSRTSNNYIPIYGLYRKVLRRRLRALRSTMSIPMNCRVRVKDLLSENTAC